MKDLPTLEDYLKRSQNPLRSNIGFAVSVLVATEGIDSLPGFRKAWKRYLQEQIQGAPGQSRKHSL
jgi:hypothetical protein